MFFCLLCVGLYMSDDVQCVVVVICCGEVVVYLIEMVYGMGVDVMNVDVVECVFDIKGCD